APNSSGRRSPRAARPAGDFADASCTAGPSGRETMPTCPRPPGGRAAWRTAPRRAAASRAARDRASAGSRAPAWRYRKYWSVAGASIKAWPKTGATLGHGGASNAQRRMSIPPETRNRPFMTRSFLPLALITLGVVFLLGNMLPGPGHAGLILVGLGI